MRFFRPALAATAALMMLASCGMDEAPEGLRRTPLGPGATVRYDLGHKPLPDIPIPIDTATWPDPTSRTGLRINASLIAPTHIEREARERFSQMEGWGTFAPITVSFDIDRTDPEYADYQGAALDLDNIKNRHQGDDFDFANDAIYLVNLKTGVPAPIDLGNGDYNYTLKKLDAYWPNDTRASERNLLFETIDESKHGAITKYSPEIDTDFDGTLDVPNLDEPYTCPDPSPHCDVATDPLYLTTSCLAERRTRDQCIADHLLTWYERETDTLILRPVLPLDEMTRYAVVVTDRTIDGKGNPVKSPFDFVYHATQEGAAKEVQKAIDNGAHAKYFGDIAGSGLNHVAFLWSFTTQPTVDDMKRLRDGLYGQGPFKRWEKQYPPDLTVARVVGTVSGLGTGAMDPAGWQHNKEQRCPQQADNLYVVKYDAVRPAMKQLVLSAFGYSEGPQVELLLKQFDFIDHFVLGSYESPFLIEGGPKGIDPNAAFNVNFVTGEGQVTTDTVQFFLAVPKETAEHKQPFDVDIYGHGYTGNLTEMLLYAGNMAEHGLATIGINAVGHGLYFDSSTRFLASSLLGGVCDAPLVDALTASRARDLNNDGVPDSGADFWSSYLFHTRDGVRQSVLDHIQLVRIMKSFGTKTGRMLCQNGKTGWNQPATEPCDVNQDGRAEVSGDFDGDGKPDIGGPTATFGTWGESLGGILSGIHGAIDSAVSSAVPGSGGAGLTDIGIRSFQGGVTEAVLLRIWGPLLVTVPSASRPTCTSASTDDDHCTVCSASEISLRWVMPDLNGTGELEIRCMKESDITDATWFVTNKTNGQVKCVTPSDDGLLRVGIPASIGDEVRIDLYKGKHQVVDYASCKSKLGESVAPRLTIDSYGKGRITKGSQNAVMTATCGAATCGTFQGHFFGDGATLTAPAEGYGDIRQTPTLRRFMQLAQAALEPGDPSSFAPYYSIKSMTDPFGKRIAPHAVLTLDTIGDMNVPLNSGIAFARAAGALPFFRPDQAEKYPEYANYVAPEALYRVWGKTPNQLLIDQHVIEGIAPLARYPAGPACITHNNLRPDGSSIVTADGKTMVCFPRGCAMTNKDPVACWDNTQCDETADKCVPIVLDQETCDEALFDVDDLDEGTDLYDEQFAHVPLRIARFTQAATPASIDEVWAPRLRGVPRSNDGGYVPNEKRPLTALLDAYIVPQGVHTFVNGDPCQNFDNGTYLTNLTARFFMSHGSDLYYLSHPKTHLCLGRDVATCDYLKTK